MTNEVNEMSAASRGSQPVAWAVMLGNRIYDHYDTDGEATAVCLWLRDFESNGKWITVPLYSHPQPTLTDKERDAVAWAVWEGPIRSTTEGAEERAATLQGLLERLG